MNYSIAPYYSDQKIFLESRLLLKRLLDEKKKRRRGKPLQLVKKIEVYRKGQLKAGSSFKKRSKGFLGATETKSVRKVRGLLDKDDSTDVRELIIVRQERPPPALCPTPAVAVSSQIS